MSGRNAAGKPKKRSGHKDKGTGGLSTSKQKDEKMGKRKGEPVAASHPFKKQKHTIKGHLGKGNKSVENGAAKEAVKAVNTTRERKSEKKEQLKSAVTQWEKLRKHDTPPEERAALIATVLKQVDGRIGQVANSPTGSRVLQACAKYGSPPQRLKMLKEVLPQFLELSKTPYAHFLLCKLIATVPRQDLKGVFSAVRGHVPILLRHPCGAAIIDELYNSASAAQRNHLAAEFYGKEYSLLTHEAAPENLTELLSTCDTQKKRIILQRMAVHLMPIMEKALIDPVITHRLIAEYIKHSPPNAKSDAFDNLSGEALLRMVHTRDGAWIANSLLCYGSAKECKKFIKALKGHVETMARDKWGSLVLCGILSHVDDTVLVRKIILTTLQEKCESLIQDKNARHIFLQLLAPNCTRYLQPELLEVVNPLFSDQNITSSASKEGNLSQHKDAAPASNTARRKDAKLRRLELLGKGEGSLGEILVKTLKQSLSEYLKSPLASDIVAESASGGMEGVLLEEHKNDVLELQQALIEAIENSEDVIEDVWASRSIRRLILNQQETSGNYSKDLSTTFSDSLWQVLKSLKQSSNSQSKKIWDAFSTCGYTKK